MARRTGLDTPTVVAAAALVNREGVAALSLKRLADELGVQTPSLYNHGDGLPGLERELVRNLEKCERASSGSCPVMLDLAVEGPKETKEA